MDQINSTKQILFQILRGRTPKAVRKEARIKLARMMEAEGVSAYCYRRFGDALPPEWMPMLKTTYLKTVRKNMLHLEMLKRIESALRSEDIQVLTLKGMSLLDDVYPSIGMRPMEDMDLLIHPCDQERFNKVLHQMGFTLIMNSDHLYYHNDVLIDVHTHPLNIDRICSRIFLFPVETDWIRENAVPWSNGYQMIKRPDHIDNVLLLSQHMMKHSFNRLKWLVDLFHIVGNKDDAFYTRLFDRAARFRQTKPLAYSFYLLQLVFGHPFQDRFEPWKNEVGRAEKMILDAAMGDRPPAQTGPLLSLFCIPGFRRRVLFCKETIFPEKKVVEKEFKGIRSSFPMLFILIRLSRVGLTAAYNLFILFRPAKRFFKDLFT